MLPENYQYCWNIEIDENSLSSKTFPKNDSNFKWKLELNPSGELTLISKSAPKAKVMCKYTMVITSRDEDGDNYKNNVKNSFEFYNEGPNSNLLGIVYSHILVEDISEYLCDSPRNDVVINIVISVSFSSIPDYVEVLKFYDFFSSILENTEFCDVTIQVEGNDLKVHKMVLAAVSPVFKASLTSDMLEKNSGFIKITDLKSETVRLMIDFIYKRRIEIPNYHIGMELLKSADIYDIPNLQELCIKYLADEINEANVFEILTTAEMSNSPDLTEDAMDFLVSNVKNYKAEDFENILKLRPSLFPKLLENVFEAFTECKNELS